MKTAKDATRNDALRQARECKGWSQEDLAERVGTSAFTVYRWERGLARPHPHYRRLLADALQCSVPELGFDGQRAPEDTHTDTSAPPDAAPDAAPDDQRPPDGPRATLRYSGIFPFPTTRLIGREAAVSTLRDSLYRDRARLLTLTGPGGVGKTRLALELVNSLDVAPMAEKRFVSLAETHDGALVAQTVAQAFGVREQGMTSVVDELADASREKSLVLVLDNCEHVLDDIAQLTARLLAAAPGMQAVATSRAPLRVRGEQEYPVTPLVLPVAWKGPVDALQDAPAVELFLERARQVAPSFRLTAANAPTVLAICQKLDGLPLAIELAAAQMRVYTPDALLAKLRHRLPLLSVGARDVPKRQQSLRETLRWSYDLLDPFAQTVFRRLAVFVGRCPVNAIASVCVAERPDGGAPIDDQSFDSVVTTLVEQSLAKCVSDDMPVTLPPQTEHAAQVEHTDVEADEVQPPDSRYLVMLATIREFAWEQLVSAGEGETVQRAHARYYLRLVRMAQEALITAAQDQWLDRLEQEHDNLRAALRWSLDHDEVEMSLQFVAGLRRFWSMRRYIREGRDWLERALALAERMAEMAERDAGDERAPQWVSDWARALTSCGIMCEMQGDYEHAVDWYERGLALRRRIGDVRGIAATLGNLANLQRQIGDYARAQQLFEEGIRGARDTSFWDVYASALNGLGILFREMGDLPRAVATHEASLAVERQHGHTLGIAEALGDLAMALAEQHEYERAEVFIEESLSLLRTLRYSDGIVVTLTNQARLALQQGATRKAIHALTDAIQQTQATGRVQPLLECLEGVAEIMFALGQWEDSARLYAVTSAHSLGVSLSPARTSARERALDHARNQLGAEVFNRNWRSGSVMALEDAIENAIAMMRTAAAAPLLSPTRRHRFFP